LLEPAFHAQDTIAMTIGIGTESSLARCERFLARTWKFGLALILLLGAGLRLIWVDDIEYKGDEEWSFQRTQQIGGVESLPWLGMPTSVEFLHPGGTVWTFVALSKLFGAKEPTELARACQLLNVAAILMLVAFTFWTVPIGQREPWFWAAALVAVNPLAVLLHRKIWPPSVIPAFTMLLIICFWYRDRRLGAVSWGFVGALLGFLYPPAMFLAAGFVVWVILYDRARVRWRWWLPGSIVGALPLIPWLCYVVGEMGSRSVTNRRWSHLAELRYWTYWLTEPFGISLRYSLEKDFGDFLSYPVVLGHATYLVGTLHVLIILAAAVLLAAVARRLWLQRDNWRSLWIGRETETAFTQNACLWGFGIVLTLTLLPVHRHYMVVTFPLMFLWLARAALAHRKPLVGVLSRGRTYLMALCLLQFLMSASFLGYIHVNQRTIQGDYGLPYGAQARR
jgi:hypothetical protein